jgi:DNA-binding response OmpR family regulator
MTDTCVLPKILILDGDEEMRRLVFDQIKTCDYSVFQSSDFNHALAAVKNSDVSLLLTSFRIPEISIYDFLKRVREIQSVKNLSILVLMRSGNAHEQEMVLNSGANDFLLFPFDRGELNSKIKTQIRRVHPGLINESDKTGRIHFKELSLDIFSYDVFFKGERVKLTPSEFKLLHALLQRPGEVLSRDRLIELVQGEGVAVIDRAVDTHIFSLRKKLGEFGDSIETIRGEGYRIGNLLAPHALG